VPYAPRQPRAARELAGGRETCPLGLEHRERKTPGVGSGAQLALRGLTLNATATVLGFAAETV